MKIKLFTLLLLLPLITHFSSKKVFASEFAFDYDVTYNVEATGLTRVKQDITVTNLTTDYFAQNFTFTISSTKLTQIKAEDPGGEIIPSVSTNAGQTTLVIPFNVKSVGINKQFTFSLLYSSRDVASKKGRIWEIIIPGIEKKAEMNSYTVHMIVPKSFGNAVYISPAPNDQGYWTHNELNGKGITAMYGKVQNFAFNLIYQLENQSNKVETIDITLPPDTAFQQVLLNRLSSAPINVIQDTDGNWLARYSLEPKETKRIVADGHVLVYLEPRKGFEVDLSPDEEKLYTQEQLYWELSPELKEIATRLKTPKAIYDFVVDYLHYDYSRVQPGIERLGAQAAYEKPDAALCMEFSDLFIALARAANIPAREVHGYAYTTNSRLQPLSLATDVLHAWVEYYNPTTRLWTPIDPTWANTTRGVDYFNKLDFNHIAFALLGVKSDYPYPAGSFKLDENSKNVFVDFDENELAIPPAQFKAEFRLPKLFFSGFPQSGQIILTNTGNTYFYPSQFELSGGMLVSYEKSDLVGVPPYGSISIPIKILSQPSLIQSNYTESVIIDGKEFTGSGTVYSTLFLVVPALIVLVLVGFGIIKTFQKQR